jgi:hypothetical protein
VPSDVIDLGNLATIPMLLAAFFGLLGCATVAVVPVAPLIVQALAAGPAHAATRIPPAQTLRME